MFYRGKSNQPDFVVEAAEDEFWWIRHSDWTSTAIGTGYKVALEDFYEKNHECEAWTEEQVKLFYRLCEEANTCTEIVKIIQELVRRYEPTHYIGKKN